MTDTAYAKSIELPSDQVFRNLKNAKCFAIDIGGSLAKVAYCSTIQRKTTHVSEDSKQKNGADHIYEVSDTDENISRLHFIKFETCYIESCLDFIQQNLVESTKFNKTKFIKATGGGAHKYTDLINSKLGVQVDKEDEMKCLIDGCNFLLKNIRDEAFIYQRHENPEYRFQGVNLDVFPYLLVTIGSGVSLIKVESENKYERIGGTSTGGGTFWGLGSLLTTAKSFDELVELAENGDHRSVDMLVKDIYGGAYSQIGLPADIIASSFGKAARSVQSNNGPTFKDEDIAKSLLLSISNDIGQIAYLHAKLHNLNRIYFGGYFIRGQPTTMHTIGFAINYWSKGEIKALFLRHEGYLGAIGAFLQGAKAEDAETCCWGENLAGSSGESFASPKFHTHNWFGRKKSSKFDMLELDRLNKPLLPCPLLLDHHSYLPDTVDLTEDEEARQYWLQCFVDSVEKTSCQAITSQMHSEDVKERAEKFKVKYLERLKALQDNPCAYGSLTVRSLLDTRCQCLQEFLFTDPWSQQKQLENECSLKCLQKRLDSIDALSFREKQLALAVGLVAGNVFDWGAREVVNIMETQEFNFEDAEKELQERPWLIDNYDEWFERISHGVPHKCAAIFCDNSGADIILGIIPFVRDLLIRGTKVILCANSRPVLNDVTYCELLILVKRVADISEEISMALGDKRLMVMESGQGSPCLDLRLIDQDLVDLIKKEDADLIIIEGMGRAVHTNFEAVFSCEALKVAVLKNRWLANRLGGNMFNVIFKYEKSKKVTSKIGASSNS